MQVEADTGVPLSVWQDLMDRMKTAKFGVIFFGMGLTMTRGKHANSEALLALTRDMNKHTRFVCKPNRGHGNVTGADNVVTWRTGYPFGVNLGRGYPRFNPGEYTTSDVLARGEADAALIIASDPMANFSQPAREHLKSIPYIALDPKETPDHAARRRRLHRRHLRHQRARHGLSHGRRADSAAARVRFAVSQRLRNSERHREAGEGAEGRGEWLADATGELAADTRLGLVDESWLFEVSGFNAEARRRKGAENFVCSSLCGSVLKRKTVCEVLTAYAKKWVSLCVDFMDTTPPRSGGRRGRRRWGHPWAWGGRR